MAEKELKKKRKTTAGPGEVVVSEAALSDMVSRLSRLEEVADVGRLAKYDDKRFKKGPNKFRITVYQDPEGKVEDRIVISWRTVKDVSKRDSIRGLIEDQQYEMTLEDGKKLLLSGYLNFSDLRYQKQIVGEEVRRYVAEEGQQLIIVLKLKDRKEPLEIDARFTN